MYFYFFNWEKFEFRLADQTEKIVKLAIDALEKPKNASANWLGTKLPKKQRAWGMGPPIFRA